MIYSKIYRILILTVCVFIGFTLLYSVLVIAGGLIKFKPDGVIPDRIETGDDKTEDVIYLDNNGRHYDIWIPARYCDFLSAANEVETTAGWYGFGWGDRDFFLSTPYASDVNIGILLKALFLPSRAVVAVQHSYQSPERRSSVMVIAADRARLEAAAEYIESWFDTNSNGLRRIPAEFIHSSYTGYSFFESRGSYSLFFTSNNWVNRVLKSADVPTALWTPLTFGVSEQSD